MRGGELKDTDRQRQMEKVDTGNGAREAGITERRRMVAGSTRKRQATGNIAVPVLADTLRAAVDNFVAAGFDVRTGNLHGGLVLQFIGMLQCDKCSAFVPAEFWNADGCVVCHPELGTIASTGNEVPA